MQGFLKVNSAALALTAEMPEGWKDARSFVVAPSFLQAHSAFPKAASLCLLLAGQLPEERCWQRWRLGSTRHCRETWEEIVAPQGWGAGCPKSHWDARPGHGMAVGGGDRGGVWPQMETGAALTIFGSCMGQGKAQGGFPSLCASIPENRRGFLSVHLLPLPTTHEHPRSTRPSAVLHGERSWSPSTHLHLSRGSPIC